MPRILIVDDDYTTRMGLEEMFKVMDYEVIGEAETGTQAVEMARDLTPDLILMDIVLPGEIDGIIAAERIKQESDAAVVFISGYCDPEYIERAKRVEPFGYVMKPFDEEEIRGFVEIALYKRNLEIKLKHSYENLKGLNRKLEDEIEERKRTELRLKRSEKQYHKSHAQLEALFENTDDFILIADQRGRPQRFNKACAQIIKELLGLDMKPGIQPHKLLANPKDVQSWDKRQGRVLAGEKFRSECHLKLANGEVRCIEISFCPIMENGKVEGFVELGRDISERKRIETELRESRQEWELIFQSTGNLSLILDSRRRVIHANAAVEKATGNAEKELIGQTCHKIFHNAQEPPEGCPFEKMMISGRLETQQMEMEALNGTYLVSCTPVLDPQGHLQKVVHIATDVTDQKKAEEALQQSVQFRERMLQSLVCGLYIHSLQKNRNEFISPQYTALTGWTLEDINKMGGKFAELFHPDDQPRVGAHFHRILNATDIDVLEIEYRFRTKDGRWIWCISRDAVFERNRQGQVIRFIGSFFDITDRKKAEETLRENRAKLVQAQYLAGIGNFTWDMATGAVTCSEGTYRMLKYDKNESIDYEKIISAIVHPDDHEGVTRWIKDGVSAGEKPLPATECRLICKDGQVIHVRANGLIEYRDGKAAKLFGTCVDITQRVIGEQRLREREAQLRIIAENTGAMLGILDNRATFIFANPAHQMLGYAPEELLGTSGFGLVHPEDVERLSSLLQRALNGESCRFTTTYRVKHKDGRDFFVKGTFDPILNTEGKLEQIVFVTEEIVRHQ